MTNDPTFMVFNRRYRDPAARHARRQRPRQGKQRRPIFLGGTRLPPNQSRAFRVRLSQLYKEGEDKIRDLLDRQEISLLDVNSGKSYTTGDALFSPEAEEPAPEEPKKVDPAPEPEPEPVQEEEEPEVEEAEPVQEEAPDEEVPEETEEAASEEEEEPAREDSLIDVLNGSVRDLEEALGDVDSLDDLFHLREAEQNGKNRKGALSAINEIIEELEEEA